MKKNVYKRYIEALIILNNLEKVDKKDVSYVFKPYEME